MWGCVISICGWRFQWVCLLCEWVNGWWNGCVWVGEIVCEWVSCVWIFFIYGRESLSESLSVSILWLSEWVSQHFEWVRWCVFECSYACERGSEGSLEWLHECLERRSEILCLPCCFSAKVSDRQMSSVICWLAEWVSEFPLWVSECARIIVWSNVGMMKLLTDWLTAKSVTHIYKAFT